MRPSNSAGALAGGPVGGIPQAPEIRAPAIADSLKIERWSGWNLGRYAGQQYRLSDWGHQPGGRQIDDGGINRALAGICTAPTADGGDLAEADFRQALTLAAQPRSGDFATR